MSNTDPSRQLELSRIQSIHSLDWTDLARENLFLQWLNSLQSQYKLHIHTIRRASADASFRRYFRVDTDINSIIVMDAPPDKENCSPFFDIAQLMLDANLKAPRILDWHKDWGFMLLEDLGSQTMLQTLKSTSEKDQLILFEKSIEALITWQLASKPNVLPIYDHVLLLREVSLFEQWYVNSYKKYTLTPIQKTDLNKVFDLLITHNLNAPSVFVHRDFMPRNLMVPENGPDTRLGILDFQDAVYGPVTYDIASLMRDAFISWDEAFVLDITVRYWQQARSAGLLHFLNWESDFGAFYKAVEWMGLQRHLKVAGIFARLSLRDNKPIYLADTPRFIGYIRATCNRYSELRSLLSLIDQIEDYSQAYVFSIGRTD